MTINEHRDTFSFDKALVEIDILSEEHQWGSLEAEARRRHDITEVETIHDLSWNITQITSRERQNLKTIKKAVEKMLYREFGPNIFKFLSMEYDIKMWSIIGPIARRKLAENEKPMPGKFAAGYMKGTCLKFFKNIQKYEPVNNKDAGRRIFGYNPDCTACGNRRLSEERVKRKIRSCRCTACDETGIDFNVLKLDTTAVMFMIKVGEKGTVKDIRNQFGTKFDCLACNGRGTTLDPKELESDYYTCPECTVWLDLPADWKNGWIYPLKYNNGNIMDWTRIGKK